MPDIHLALRELPFPTVASALGLDVAKYQRKGKDFAGPCPVHNGKNANSFRYEINGGRWHCFSCAAKGRGGIDLVIAVKGIKFQAAVELLSPLVGQTPVETEKPPVKADSEATGELKPFTGKYERYAVPCPWLEERVPDKGIREKYGVFCYNNKTRKSAYSGRVMLPVRDEHGSLFGYLGRSIDHGRNSGTTEEVPKYLFPKNLPKSRFLFGADVLKAGMFGSLPLRVCYLVESPFAVMKFASMGIPAVSCYGWSVSQEQIQLLKQVSKGVVYLPDRNKRESAPPVLTALAEHLWVRFPPLPDGIDDPEQMTKEMILAL